MFMHTLSALIIDAQYQEVQTLWASMWIYNQLRCTQTLLWNTTKWAKRVQVGLFENFSLKIWLWVSGKEICISWHLGTGYMNILEVCFLWRSACRFSFQNNANFSFGMNIYLDILNNSCQAYMKQIWCEWSVNRCILLISLF